MQSLKNGVCFMLLEEGKAYTSDIPENEKTADSSVLSTFDRLTDEEIVLLCHQNNPSAEEYLLNKYKNHVNYY